MHGYSLLVIQNVFLMFNKLIDRALMTHWFQPYVQISNNKEDINIPEPPPIDAKRINLTKLTPKELELLTYLIDEGVKKLDSYAIKHNEKLGQLKERTTKFSREEILDLLESMSKKGIIETTMSEPNLHCPKCDSQEVKAKFVCPKCISSVVHKYEILEHPYCGYRGTWKEFKKNEELICPKCHTILSKITDNLKSIKKEHYKVIGSIFECEKCKNRMSKPDIRFNCNKCGENFSWIESIYKENPIYTISDAVYKQISQIDDIKVLIIEDFEPEAEVMKYLLMNSDSRKRYQVDQAQTGSMGLSKFNEGHYDVVILDLSLPDMYGIQILDKIIENEPETIVIIFTGYDDRETAVEAIKRGASEYIIKTGDEIQNLPDIIERLLYTK